MLVSLLFALCCMLSLLQSRKPNRPLRRQTSSRPLSLPLPRSNQRSRAPNRESTRTHAFSADTGLSVFIFLLSCQSAFRASVQAVFFSCSVGLCLCFIASHFHFVFVHICMRRNARTVKECNFFGPRSEYVMSGRYILYAGYDGYYGYYGY